jgi:hypothetical protein
MQVDRETETECGHAILIQSNAESIGGRTLVTLNIDSCVATSLFPQEARELARVLARAADLAEGV